MPIAHTAVMPEAEFDTRTVSRRAGQAAVADLLLPVDALPETSSSPDLICRRVRDELMLDGNARLNLATFVTTWMEPQARELMAETAEKNLADRAEYPQITAMEERCVRMLARLWRAPRPEQVRGCSTTGSSEAAMLGGLALKRRWQERRRAQGKDIARPNLVMGANVQVCWKKFANYFEVEPRYVPMEPGRYHLTADALTAYCDDNTIGVVAILGSTFDGSYEPVADICMALDGYQAATGTDIPVHVDGASGAMVAPFLDPDLMWDFQLERVASINTSGHKYGHVFPGLGWALWRDAEALPDDLVFEVDYLGGSSPSFTLNFSRPGAHVVAQYYSFLRYGFEGLRELASQSRTTARALAARIRTIAPYELITDGSELPAFAFRLTPGTQGFTVFDVSHGMRARGWHLPAYSFPAPCQDVSVLRLVVRTGFTAELAGMFIADLTEVTRNLHTVLPTLAPPLQPLVTA
ncbi:glutamate decarboxylase [Streptomyces sp. 3213]|uniref:glutamate decarboxylase n=1 Tax=Streptomyces sp. 3213.3 TaxID=1855348 RepID=UPI0008953EC3|nr:glutamate decarboxylase [Streptomyces sp. 3213.3]SEC48720.1 glutamate decarboxylase [Streptomyces sp. 3213] [Streptomyces sp. 3213.3]